jgi:alpha-tubulin suppressor-like RCC1 family protein
MVCLPFILPAFSFLCHQCSFFFADDGKIINWGRNTYGQLGCHEYQRPLSWKPQIMNNIENVVQLAVGSEHNIAILGMFELIFYIICQHTLKMYEK